MARKKSSGKMFGKLLIISGVALGGYAAWKYGLVQKIGDFFNAAGTTPSGTPGGGAASGGSDPGTEPAGNEGDLIGLVGLLGSAIASFIANKDKDLAASRVIDNTIPYGYDVIDILPNATPSATLEDTVGASLATAAGAGSSTLPPVLKPLAFTAAALGKYWQLKGLSDSIAQKQVNNFLALDVSPELRARMEETVVKSRSPQSASQNLHTLLKGQDPAALDQLPKLLGINFWKL